MTFVHDQFPGNVEWCGIAINRGEGFASRLIAQASVSKWWLLLPAPRILDGVASHVRVIFGAGDRTLYYFEARGFDGAGWKGPFPESEARTWANGHPRRWTRCYRYLPGSSEAVERMWHLAVHQKGCWSYDHFQLLRLWVTRWTGKQLPGQDNGVFCSEAAAILWEVVFNERFSAGPHDRLTPYDVQRCLVAPTWQVVR